MDTYLHQQQWIDMLEGREPANLHPAISYKKGREDRVLLNTPPFHAKSATITRDYITYKLCMNPNYRVIIVSKTQQQAKKFLYSIRQILTSSMYAELQAAYAPAEGFKGTRDGGAWTSNLIYLAGRESSEKDPSVEALGIGGQIYGARADLIVLDDAVTLGNANEHEKQFTWINQEVAPASRAASCSWSVRVLPDGPVLNASGRRPVPVRRVPVDAPRSARRTRLRGRARRLGDPLAPLVCGSGRERRAGRGRHVRGVVRA
jgi:hypothetical protein